MHPLLSRALAETRTMVADRGWIAPNDTTLAAAERLIALVAPQARTPDVQVEPDGTISFEWEAADLGWLRLIVDDRGQLTHSAVIGEDEFTQAEDFGDVLPAWAAELLGRLMRAGH